MHLYLPIVVVLLQAAAPAAAQDGGVADPGVALDADGGTFQAETWGEFDPGKGFRVAKTERGDLWISAYALVRYMNQLPANQVFQDHLGVTREVKSRNDIQLHRAMVHFRGFVFLPRLTYVLTVWTVMSNDILKLIGTLGYTFHRALTFSVGIDGLPGVRTLVGSHPYWLGHDRTMAEEFARPGFTAAAFATGELLPGLFYKASVGNNLSQLGLNATLLTRDLAVAGTVWWMPTTAEFGPKGGQGDYERHDRVATRFGMSATRSDEAHFTPLTQPPASTQIRTAEGVPLFDSGALEQGVTLEKATYSLLSFDAGLKFRGIFLQAEGHLRWLTNFVADGQLPVSQLFEQSFFVMGSFFVIPQRWELYGGTSVVFGDRSAGFKTQWEVVGGSNIYPADSRNFRLNLHTLYVDRSAAGGTFGYYSTGQKGVTLAIAASIFF